MVLAAGRGERMRPLSDHAPKPMLPVRGKPLMQWTMQALQAAGVQDAVVNTAWLGEQIPQYFGDGLAATQAQATLRLHYSHEGVDFGEALETAGGIVRALPRLADAFWVVAGDVWIPEFAFAKKEYDAFQASDQLAHIWLVPNPTHNPRGDFGIAFDQQTDTSIESTVGRTGRALNLPADSDAARWTFSTVALYKRAFFEADWCTLPAGNSQGVRAALAPMLRAAMDNARVRATLYTQTWSDVGTPERLAELNR